MIPLAFELRNRRVLVLGAGRVATGKTRLLLDSGAHVSVIAEHRLVEPPDGVVSFEERCYRPGDLDGFMLIVSATGDPATNDLVVAEARERGIWINVVDDPRRSDFFFTAVHRSGDVIVSVSTQGASPALAQVVRDRIRDSLPPRLGEVAQALRDERRRLHESGQSTEDVDWRELIAALWTRASRVA